MDSRKDLVSGSVLLLFAVAVYIAARGIERRIPMGVDSGYFPELASGALALLALFVVVRGLVGMARRRAESGATSESGILRVAGAFVAIVIYGLSIPYTGFILATFVFLMVSFAILPSVGAANRLKDALLAAIMTAAIYLIFTYAFGVILPRGLF